MTPRTIKIGKCNQNGDVEAGNGALKRYVDQQLMLRGSHDFATHDDYIGWLCEIFEARNRTRGKRLEEELAVMEPVTASPVPEYAELRIRVSPGSTIRVKTNTYSVPSQLKDEWVKVRVFDERIEVYYADKLRVVLERLIGKQRHRINYRHVVPSMLRKAGAFRRYRFRDDLFPTETFRRAFEVLDAALPERKADIEYLRILHLAAKTMEVDVEEALSQILASGVVPYADLVKARVAPERLSAPDLPEQAVDLVSYDDLLEQPVEALA